MDTIVVSVTSKQKEMIERAAAQDGFDSVGEWLTFLAAERERPSVDSHEELVALIRESEERGGAIPWTPELAQALLEGESAVRRLGVDL